jgi:hypothetical protein
MNSIIDSDWAQFRFTTVLIRLSKRYADITYSLGNNSLVRIENISEKLDQDIEADFYLSVLNALLSSGEHIDKQATQTTIANFAGWTMSSPRYPGKLEHKIWDVLLLPLVQGQAFLYSHSDHQDIMASFCKESYKIVLSQPSLQIFTAFSVIILVWCLVLLAVSGISRRPEVSSFPELDLVSKIPVYNEDGFCGVCSRISEAPVRDIGKEIGDTRIFCEVGSQAQELEASTANTENDTMGSYEPDDIGTVPNSIA